MKHTRLFSTVLAFSTLFAAPSQSFAANFSIKATDYKAERVNVGVCYRKSTNSYVPCKKLSATSAKELKKKDVSSSSLWTALRVSAAELNGLKTKLKGLSSLPASSDMIAGTSAGVSSLLSKLKSSDQMVSAVSGTPPTLSEIAAGNPAQIFWAPGVIDAIVGGAPTQNQCSSLFGDENSGGLGACYMAQNVGFSFSPLIEGGASACYMRSFPTAENVASGGVTITKGDLPSGGITKIFSPPTTGSARIVKAAVSREGHTENVFLKIYSASQNAAAGNRYRYDLWFCDPEGNLTGYENTAVKQNGQYTNLNAHNEEGNESVAQVKAYLIAEGNDVVFDDSQGRTLTISNVNEFGKFKADVTVTAANLLKVKQYDMYGDSKRLSYTVAQFTGADVGGLRFYSGAFKDISMRNNETEHEGSGATEYQDDHYVATNSSSLLSELDAVNLSTNSFYSSEPSASFNASAYSCDAAANIELTLDFDNEAMAGIPAACEGEKLHGMDFCRTGSLETLMENFGNYCHG